MLVPADKRQQGFSLVEVLIALVIMSVGMLGIATLFLQGMQAGRTSMFRHNAVILVGDVADRIRANPTAGAAYAGAGVDSGCVGQGTNCSQPQMASHDIFLWTQQAAESLPAGSVNVVFDKLLNLNEISKRFYTVDADLVLTHLGFASNLINLNIFHKSNLLNKFSSFVWVGDFCFVFNAIELILDRLFHRHDRYATLPSYT